MSPELRFRSGALFFRRGRAVAGEAKTAAQTSRSRSNTGSKNGIGLGRNRQRGAEGTRSGASGCNSIAFGILTVSRGRGEKRR